MLPDPVLNPGPLTYESGALPIALRGPAQKPVEGTIFFFIIFVATELISELQIQYVRSLMVIFRHNFCHCP